MLAATYSIWALAVVHADTLGWPAYPIVAISLAQFSSLQHEVVHGHPSRNPLFNEALVFAAIGLFYPYRRFRDLHLAHHRNDNLTDPLADPESWYLEPAEWARKQGWVRALYRVNNSLAGRMVFGPALSLVRFWRGDLAAIIKGNTDIQKAWLLHGLGLVPVIAFLQLFGSISPTAYIACAYGGASLIMIRTFAEHRAHESAGGRSVIIEDRGPLALLFLNNNLHAVHHAFPGRPWYQLPGLYRRQKDRFRRRNRNYVFHSYLDVFRRFGLKAKEPVPHPFKP